MIFDRKTDIDNKVLALINYTLNKKTGVLKDGNIHFHKVIIAFFFVVIFFVFSLTIITTCRVIVII